MTENWNIYVIISILMLSIRIKRTVFVRFETNFGFQTASRGQVLDDFLSMSDNVFLEPACFGRGLLHINVYQSLWSLELAIRVNNL